MTASNFKVKPVKQVKCKICRGLYTKLSMMHKVCSPPCAIELTRQEKEKKARKEYLAKKVIMRSKRDWLKLAQQAFNAFIRARDAGQPCISCQRHHNGQYHAGHYLTTGARPELRFEESQVHLQCAPCNNHLSGNIALYRINLIKKIGIDRVEWLEGPHEPKKWTIERLQTIIKEYKAKLKEL